MSQASWDRYGLDLARVAAGRSKAIERGQPCGGDNAPPWEERT